MQAVRCGAVVGSLLGAAAGTSRIPAKFCETFTAGALLLTPPVPQSLALLDVGGFKLIEPIKTRLEAIE